MIGNASLGIDPEFLSAKIIHSHPGSIIPLYPSTIQPIEPIAEDPALSKDTI